MLKRFIPIITLLMLNFGAQAEESQENPKCPDDPTGFKGKEDDCFDCLTGALTKLKEFTTEVDKMLDDKKLTTAEEAESLKTRSEGLWDGVAGWQKICEPNVESKEKPEGEEASKAENEATPEGEGDANAEEANTEESEPKAEEDDAKAETDTEVKPESETEPEGAAEEPEAEMQAEPVSESEPEAETETEAEPEADT